MADVLVDKRAINLDISDRFEGYSRVVIRTGETDINGNEIVYISGDETGRTLEIDNPWGNQAVADNILEKIQGWAYQPMESEGASVNPAFEVGDSVTVNNVFSGIYDSKITFSKLYLADIAAPADKEINHEYQFESNEQRSFTRKLNDARMNFYSDKIEAKVDKVSEGTTFGWSLDEDSWDVFNNNGTIFSIDSSGAYIKGEVQASSGKIGGFNIGSRGLWNNQSSFGGQEQTGVYIGTDGIQLGTKFRVDSQGNLYAASGTFDGNIYAKNIQYGGTAGFFNGGGILSATLGTAQMMQGIINSLGFADFSNDVFNKRDIAEYCYAKYLLARNDVTAPTYYIDYGGGQRGSVNTHTHYVEVSGNTVTIGSPDFSGTPHPFEIATSDNISVSQNGVATYQSGYRRYAVPIKATDSNGNTVASATIYVSATQAYDAGYNSGYSAGFNACDVNWSDGDWDIWVSAWNFVGGQIQSVNVNAKLENGRQRGTTCYI